MSKGNINRLFECRSTCKKSLPLLFILSISCNVQAVVTNERYQTAFLRGNIDPEMLDRYLGASVQSESVLPGNYNVDIIVNGEVRARQNITFKADAATQHVNACFTADQLHEFGINIEKLVAEKILTQANIAESCINLQNINEYISVNYNPARLALNITVPQSYSDISPDGYVNPKLWDKGINAAFMNYNYSYNNYQNKYHSRRENTDSQFLSLQGGMNFSMWRLRWDGNYNKTSGERSKFNSNNLYLARDITRLRSQLVIGDIYTDSQIFDGVRMRGIKLSTDDGMLSPAELGYAPIIRGVAQSNATVEIKQNDYVIYQSNVTPGPFEITDLVANSGSGDLVVTVTEADGSKRTFIQAFSALPVMVRQGTYQYSFSAGKFRQYVKHDADGNKSYQPEFVTLKQVYGLGNTSTVFSGAQLSRHYQAYNVGLGQNTRFGGISADITYSRSKSNKNKAEQQGYSTRLLYGKTFTEFGTSFTLAGYRYSTKNYRTFSEHIDDWDTVHRSLNSLYQKSRIEANISQSLPEALGAGSFYLSGSWVNYWYHNRRRNDYRIGYSNTYKQLNYNLYFARSQTSSDSIYSQYAKSDKQIMLNFSFTLGGSVSSPRVTTNIRQDANHNTAIQTGINGYMTEDFNNYYDVNYNLNENHDSSGGVGIGTRRSFGQFYAGYNQGKNYHSSALNAQGSLLVHSGGITLGQPMGDSATLVEVTGVNGVAIDRDSAIKTNFQGYAIIPSMLPYRANWISLDAGNNADLDVDFDNTTAKVIPRRGAITYVKFGATSGRRVQFELLNADGQRLPLGTEVYDEFGNLLGLLDMQGRLLVLLLEDQGNLNVKWKEYHCQVPYRLPEKTSDERFNRIKLTCGKM
ncbi:MAG: fimbrial biogenesis outer membrane usher protein [Enterobacteriaceae bacterium]|jgi:outer membrane usher protein|nr:fimbrial biogenesis outer membrane usher protein [Enterobacteriaceae bacterium]